MLKFSNVTVKFNDKYILRNFSLDLKEGGKFLLYGRSGVGKSTVLRLALGYIKPDEGEILFDGKLLNKETIMQVRRSVAYVSQDMEIGGGNVEDHLKNVFLYKANSRITLYKSYKQEIFSYFEFDQSLLRKNIEELSGGEKQRLMIITALLLKRKVFLLDEITSALDQNLKQKVISYFLDKPEWTELIVSHDAQWSNDGSIKTINMEDLCVNG